MKKTKPTFRRTDGHRYKKLKNVYRKGKGLHNKMKDGRKGHPSRPNIGYGNDKKEYGLVKGLEPVLISNGEQLQSVKSDSQGVILSSKIGQKKKINLIKKAEELKLNILNLDTKEFLKKIEEKKKSKKSIKETKESKKEEHKQKAEERLKEKEKKESETTEEEKKEIQDEDKRKVIEQG